MKYDPQFIGNLLARHLMVGLTAGEREILEDWVALSGRNRGMLAELENPVRRQRLLQDYEPFDTEAAWLDMVEMAPGLLKGEE